MSEMCRRTSGGARILAILASSCILLVCVLPLLVGCGTEIEDYADTEGNTTPSEDVVESSPTETIPEEKDWELVTIPVEPNYPDVTSFVTIFDVQENIDRCTVFTDQLKAMLDGMSEDHPQYSTLCSMHDTAMNKNEEYRAVLASHWDSRERSRPIMTEIWRYLTTEGNFSLEVTAGIIGNMCAEAGGRGYEDIKVYNWDYATGRSYYGVCQWSVKFYPEIANTNLRYQLDYLIDSYDYAFTNWGSNYSSRYGSKFRTEQFLAMKDPYEAAIAFALCYERCAKAHVELRGPLAENAYTYFTVLESWPWP